MREAEGKKPGYQRLRILQYDELRRKLTSSQGLTMSREAVRPPVAHCALRYPLSPAWGAREEERGRRVGAGGLCRAC